MTTHIRVVWLCTRHNLIAKVFCVLRTKRSSSVYMRWCVHNIYIYIYAASPRTASALKAHAFDNYHQLQKRFRIPANVVKIAQGPRVFGRMLVS